MSIEMSLTMFYSLFVAIPISLFILFLYSEFLEKEKEVDLLLEKEFAKVLHKYESKIKNLSKEEEEHFNTLKGLRCSYVKAINNVFFQWLIMSIFIFPNFFKSTKKSTEKTKIESKKLISMSYEIIALIIVGISEKNRLLSKIFYLKYYDQIKKIEFDSLVDQPAAKKDIIEVIKPKTSCFSRIEKSIASIACL